MTTSKSISFKNSLVTFFIIAINVLVYAAMASSTGKLLFNIKTLLHWGANYAPVTTRGEWWRFLTCVFLHGSIGHLLLNMYALVFAGIFLEAQLGKIKFTCIYLLTGIIASASSIWWYAHILSTAKVSVGASGAVFGLYGCLVAVLIRGSVRIKGVDKLLASILIFIVANVGMGLLKDNIDNGAHIGGLLSGFLLGLFISPEAEQAELTEESIQPLYHAKPKYPELVDKNISGDEHDQ